ncbi:hypothetical protein IV203_029818 [Nitzschia inconspicua]|uniref:Uncharacterized protein n=1 Tax=Nitzschia inconspicua TaxID=303405 RepID=A0A9K3LRG6_9STRA|nr:hypothetical protein IV203_029818 [Nitzschia inconspicua]
MSMPAMNPASCVPAPTRVSSAAPVPAVASYAYSNNSGNTGKCNNSSNERNHGRGQNWHHRVASSYVPSIPKQLSKDCSTPEQYITNNMEYFGYIAIFFLDTKNLTLTRPQKKDTDVGMDEFAIELALWVEEMWAGEIRSFGKGCTLMENLCAVALKFGRAWILASIKGVTHRFEDKRYVNLFITHAITDFHILQQRLDPSVADCYQGCYSKYCAKDLWCFVDSADCCSTLFLGSAGCCPTSSSVLLPYPHLGLADCCPTTSLGSAGCCLGLSRLLPYLFLGFSWSLSYLFLGLTGCCPTSFLGPADFCNMLSFAPTTVSSAAFSFAPTTVSSAVVSFAPTTVSSAVVSFAPTTVSSAAHSFAPTTVSSAALSFAPTTVSSAALSFAPTTVSSAALSFAPTTVSSAALSIAPTTVSSAAHSFAPTTVSSAALSFAPTTVSLAALSFAPTTVSSAALPFVPTTISSAAAAAPTLDALTANGASNNGNGGSSRHRGQNRRGGNHVSDSSTFSSSSYKGDVPGMNGHIFRVFSESTAQKQFPVACNALQQCVETNMAHSGAQDDFLDVDCASAFAVNLSHAGNKEAYMEQDDVLSQGADMSLEANQEPDQEHRGRTPQAGGSTNCTPTKAKATNDQVVVFMMMHLPCFDSNPQLYDPHPTNCIDVRIIGTIALKCWNQLFPTKFPAFFQDDVQAVVAEAKFVSLEPDVLPRGVVNEPDVFPRGVLNENLEHDLFSTTAPDANAYSVLQAQDDVLDLVYASAPTAAQISKDNQGASTDQHEVLFQGADVQGLGEDQGANHDGSRGAKKGTQGAGGTANYLPPAGLENNPLDIIQNVVSSRDGSKVSLGLGKGATKALSQRHPNIESRDDLRNDSGTDDFLHLDDADQVPAENQGVYVNQDDVLFQGANVENPAEDGGSIQEAHAMENQGADMAEKQEAICFVVKKNSFKTPSVCFLKALYGCVKSALLWCKGFELNPYNPCVTNKMFNGKQCTAAWYVDDNEISHVDPQVVTNMITAIEGHFRKMTVTRGRRRHKFLGMDITFTSDETVSILMEDYLNSVIKLFGEPNSSSASSAAGKGLLKMNPVLPDLAPKERVDLHGSIVPNRRASAGQKSLHINIRHFFITDRVKTEGLNIVHCPTEEMLADFFTKPLQGTLFRKFRDVILGHKPLSSLSVPVTSLREERVGRDIETQTLLRTGTLLENAEKHSEADLMENAKKHSEAASRAGKSSILEAPSRRTYADVLRGCEGPKVTDNGITGRDKGNVSRGCKSIADGVVCTNKIGRDGVVSVSKIGDGVVSVKKKNAGSENESNIKKGTEDAVTFLK